MIERKPTTQKLNSWNDTPTKKTILDFVAAVTDESSSKFVPPEERIAVFDNDGTLWCEKPMYIQFDYFLRKLAHRAENDSSLRVKMPWKAAWEKDFAWLGGLLLIIIKGMTATLKFYWGAS